MIIPFPHYEYEGVLIMTKKLKMGLIGVGRQGSNHYNNLLTIDDVDLQYVCDLKVDDTWRQKYSNIPHVVKDYNDILNDPSIDAVLIATSTDAHAEIVLRASQAKKHIFCEKPFSLTTPESKIAEILKTVRDNNVKLQMGFNRRMDPQFQDIYHQVRDGKIGTPQIVKTVSRDPFVLTKELIQRVGTFPFDFTIHDLDLARFMVGSNIKEIYAKGGTLIDPTLKEINDVDTIALVLEFENGAFGLIDNSRQAVYGYDQRVEVFGSKGMVKAENVSKSTVERYSSENEIKKNPLPIFNERFHEAYIDEIKYFVDAVQNDKPVIADGIDAVFAQRAAIATDESIKSGKPIRLDTHFDY
jgi:myo-inositol 2-dehydrogenase/D-chiro-inositol 1-dehydrogenase